MLCGKMAVATWEIPTASAVLFGMGFLIGVCFLWKYLGGDGAGHVQSLILAALLLGMRFQASLIAFMADLSAANRKLLEDLRFKSAVFSQNENADLKRQEYG